MNGFHEIRFPMRLALGAVGGPERRTEILTLASGKEIRNGTWSQSRRRWDVGSAISDLSDLQALLNFFEARQGRLYGFRFRDPLDHSSASPGSDITPSDQRLGLGNGQVTAFQLLKQYSGTTRLITKPVIRTVRVAVDNVEQTAGWTVETSTGMITFHQAPRSGASITAGFEFDCPVRFESDQINGVIEAFGTGRVVSVSLTELL